LADRRCELCQAVGPFDRIAPTTGWLTDLGEYAPITRCRDHGACRDRVLAAGEAWPLPECKCHPRQVA
jgi:hypothetical protein